MLIIIFTIIIRRLWANCVKEPTKALVDECQRDSVKFLLAKKSKFVPLEAELSVRRKNKRVSYDKVRKLEAYLLAFRDYANLVVMQLTPLIQLYCDKDNHDQHGKESGGLYLGGLANSMLNCGGSSWANGLAFFLDRDLGYHCQEFLPQRIAGNTSPS